MSGKQGYLLEDFLSIYDHPSSPPLLLHSTPYTVGQEKRRVKWHKEGQIRVTLGNDRKHLKSEMGEDKQDGTQSSWFKITVSILE